MLKFRVQECEISLSTGFFAVITLMLITCETSLVLQSLLCSLFHELGHIIAMIFFGERLRNISFSAVGIKIDKFSVTALSYSQEIIVSLAGIFANCLLSLTAFACYSILAFKPAGNTAVISLMVGCFNILPIASLDGARALHFLLMSRVPERQADMIIVITSTAFVVFLAVFSIIVSLHKGPNFSLIFATTYLMLLLFSYICRFKT